jgi:hypothetical protein
MPPKRRNTRLRKLSRGLQDLIDRWDPVDLLKNGALKDEYACLVGPILSRLERGENPDQLGAWLGSHIADHFGVPCTNARRFAAKARACHEALPPDVETRSRAVYQALETRGARTILYQCFFTSAPRA